MIEKSNEHANKTSELFHELKAVHGHTNAHLAQVRIDPSNVDAAMKEIVLNGGAPSLREITQFAQSTKSRLRHWLEPPSEVTNMDRVRCALESGDVKTAYETLTQHPNPGKSEQEL